MLLSYPLIPRHSVSESSFVRYARILKVYQRHMTAPLNLFSELVMNTQTFIQEIEMISSCKSYSIRPVSYLLQTHLIASRLSSNKLKYSWSLFTHIKLPRRLICWKTNLGFQQNLSYTSSKQFYNPYWTRPNRYVCNIISVTNRVSSNGHRTRGERRLRLAQLQKVFHR